METPRPLQESNNNGGHNNNDENNDAAAAAAAAMTSSMSSGAVTAAAGMDSPKTPDKSKFDDDYDTDEIESPKYPHLIPINSRRYDDDLDDVRIGWDDGCGCVYYEDDDYVIYRNGKRLRRSRTGRLIQDRRHRFFTTSEFNNNSPSPTNNSEKNNLAVQQELNDYLGRVLQFLSAQKKKRDLLKSKREAEIILNDNIKSLLDDSSDDELMMLCTQNAEKALAEDDGFAENTNKTKNVSKFDSFSIEGISPLKDTDDNVNNNSNHHVAKKFKSLSHGSFNDKINKNSKSLCHTITSSDKENKSATTNISPISLFNDFSTNDDDWFSAIDLSEIEQQISSDKKTTTSVPQKSNTQQLGTKMNVKCDNKPGCSSTSTITSNSSSVLWRRSTSTSAIIKNPPQISQPQQDKKLYNGTNGTQKNSRTDGNTKVTTTRYCTPAEIEEKRNRARRTLMLKFKSKNKSIN